MNDTTIAQVNEATQKISRISWGAVLAGTLTTIALMMLLNLLGLGIGLTTIDPLTESDPLAGLGTGTAIWWILSNTAALFTGGLVAGRMSGYTANIDGALHGFLTWGLYFLIGVFMLTSAIGGALNGIGNMVSGLTGGDASEDITVQIEKAITQGNENAGNTSDNLRQEMFDLIRTGEKYNVLPEDAAEETSKFLQESKRELKQLNLKNDIEDYVNDISFNLDKNGNLTMESDGENGLIDTEKLKNSLIGNTELSEAEIDGIITKWETRLQNAIDKVENTYAEAKQKLTEYSDAAADAAGTAGIIAFFILLLGGGAAFLGGITGSPDYAVLLEEDRKNRGKKSTGM